MKKKIKTYNIMLSKVFPAKHPLAGMSTGFHLKVKRAKGLTEIPVYLPKEHTIRANYELWAKRIAEVQAGEAELVLREWIGKPYRSKTLEIMRLTAADEVGVQCLKVINGDFEKRSYIDGIRVKDISTIARLDGLDLRSWIDWFRDYDFSKPLAIIHFSSFRY